MTEPHAITRARERYGLSLEMDDLRAMVRLIRSGRRIYLRPSDDGCEIHAISYAGIWLPVVWSTASEWIVTILPPTHLPLKRPRRRIARRSPRDFREVAV